jgi:hypothetical protein
MKGICPEYVVVAGAILSMKNLRACINSPLEGIVKEEIYGMKLTKNKSHTITSISVPFALACGFSE